ncbi:MAG: signal peptidase I [Cellulomonadaceae bacterium]|nr:signal peptidase I [Cellulomonadaceae bacterium]
MSANILVGQRVKRRQAARTEKIPVIPKRSSCCCRRKPAVRWNCAVNPRRFGRVLLKWLPRAGLGLVALGYVVAFLVPQMLGGVGLTVLSGSMAPSIRAGDVVAVQLKEAENVCDSITEGDIITFMPYPNNPLLVTHRVISAAIGQYEGWNCQFITQGDANSAPDEPVLPNQIRGRVMYSVRWAGWLDHWAGANRDRILIAVVVISLGWLGYEPTKRIIERKRGQLNATPS